MGNNEHSLDRIERNAAAESLAPSRRMGLLTEEHINTIAAALASQAGQFQKMTTGGSEDTDAYFARRLIEVKDAYDAIIHFGHAGL